MVSPAASAAKEVSASTAEKSWREAVTQAAAESAETSQPPQDPAQLQFEVVYVQSTAEACKALHGALTDLRFAFIFSLPSHGLDAQASKTAPSLHVAMQCQQHHSLSMVLRQVTSSALHLHHNVMQCWS